jgi:hypothetical protein
MARCVAVRAATGKELPMADMVARLEARFTTAPVVSA